MSESLVTGALGAVGVYLLIGLLCAIPLQWRGLRAIDAATGDAGYFFRALVTPGLVTFWPLLLLRWRQAAAGKETAGPLEGRVRQEGLRRWHGIASMLLLLCCPAIIVTAVSLNKRPPGLTTSRPELVPPPRLYRTMPNFGQLFPSVPAKVILGRTIGHTFGLVFDFQNDEPVPPMALYWSESLGAPVDTLPPDAVFVDMIWHDKRHWCTLREDRMRSRGYWMVYSFLEDRVEYVPVQDAMARRGR